MTLNQSINQFGDLIETFKMMTAKNTIAATPRWFTAGGAIRAKASYYIEELYRTK